MASIIERVAALRSSHWGRGTILAGEEPIGPVVNRLAWPVVIENLLHTLLGVVDLILVGALGASALAGVGAAIQVLWVIQSAFSAVTTGTTVLVAHAMGAGRPEEANRVVKQSLLVGAALSAIVGALGGIFATPIMTLLGGEPDVIVAGAIFFQIGAMTALFMLVMLIVGAALRGAGDSKTPMTVTLWTNVLNAGLAWVLIFGHLGFPALGVAGSAWATAIARGLGMVWMLAVLVRGQGALRLDWRGHWAPDLTLLKRTLHIGIPSMIEMTMMSGGMLVYGLFALRLGTDVYAAQRITLNVVSFAFMPSLGYGMAATTLTGQSLGAKDPRRAVRTTWYAVWSCLGAISIVSLVMIVFSPLIMRVFTHDENLIRIGSDALRIVALSQPFHSVGQVLAGSLRGAGDTRFAMYATAGAIWLVRLPLAYVLGPVLHLSLAIIYLSNLLDSMVRLWLLWGRFRAGRWQFLKV